jgi:hypothetical protein
MAYVNVATLTRRQRIWTAEPVSSPYTVAKTTRLFSRSEGKSRSIFTASLASTYGYANHKAIPVTAHGGPYVYFL